MSQQEKSGESSVIDADLDADAPFDPSAKSDIVFRTADKVHFYVFKAFLCFASSFFESMFSLPQPTKDGDQKTRNNLPVIDVSEDSSIFRHLLIFCYPTPSPRSISFDDLVAVVVASDKYGMDTLAGEVGGRLMASAASNENPLRVFAIAFHHGWKNLGKAAAKDTLKMTTKALPFCQELGYLTGIESYQLSEYRFKCAQVAVATASATIIAATRDSDHIGFLQPTRTYFSSSSLHDQVSCEAVKGHGVGSPFYVGNVGSQLEPVKWWWTFARALCAKLESCPRGSTIKAKDTIDAAVISASRCRVCAPKLQFLITEFVDDLDAKVEHAVSKVPLNITFPVASNLPAETSS